MKLSYQLVIDQIDDQNLTQVLAFLEGLSRKHDFRVRFKKDGRTSSPLKELSEVILEMLQN